MLGVKAYNSFGMTEMNGPGVAFECTEQDGMHFWEDATWSKSLTRKPVNPYRKAKSANWY